MRFGLGLSSLRVYMLANVDVWSCADNILSSFIAFLLWHVVNYLSRYRMEDS